MNYLPPPYVKSAPRKVFVAVLCTLLLGQTGCIDNQTHPDLQPWLPPGNGSSLIGCTPNLDGVIASSELVAAIGIPARYRLSFDQAIEPQGQISASGKRTWDWGWSSAGEQALTIAAEDIQTKWYAADFAGGQFTTPFDLENKLDAVYTKDDKGLWLIGLVSRQQKPAGGVTRLRYDPPVLAVKLPLKAGDAWTSVGKVQKELDADGNSKNKFNGLPYAGSDTYAYKVTAGGSLVLPDLAVDQVLQVSVEVKLEPVVGKASTSRQISFFAECLGEVARAVATTDEPAELFTKAAQLRRLGL